MESKLYEAAAEGNVTIFLELIRQDHLLLDRVLVNYAIETPLHVAAMLGHTDFVREIIQRKPEFTRELDSRGSSPLHLASAKGYVDIVKALLFVNPDMCLAVDIEERNPLHLAAMKGQVHVLNELVRVRPQAARVTVSWGETILHLCVKYGQFASFKAVVEVMNNQEFVNAKDDYGMTVLHLAVAYKQIETIKFLLTSTSVEVNGLNANGLSALDVLARSRRGLKDFDIAESLRDAGALRAAEISHWRIETPPLIAQNVATNQPDREYQWVQKTYKKEDWLTRKRDSLMVVASLMATMSFQAGLTPPGGLWQDDFTGAATERSHEAGTSIIADTNQSYYSQYLAANTISFMASMSIILLLITGLPFKRRLFMWILTVIVWIAISSMGFTYRISLLVFTPKSQKLTVTRVLEYAVIAWIGVMALLLLAHTIRLIVIVFSKVENVKEETQKPPPPLSYTKNINL
ncbi:hypothetical protein V6Z12_D06G099100, partial [Gossypium hirsutum]|uniref:Ankyrin repeat-containing protein BDA1 n=1 Tax=Gossypium hirsutum TaxID=3635 RepID=A0A1U8KDM2_GOSHI|nr:ankyrin repeat-containing protein BDA1-like [Gossypium hirsutum]